MTSFARAGFLGCVALVLVSCSLPGIPRTSIQARQAVFIGGQTCEYVERLTETNTTNGISRFVEGEITCGSQAYSCGTLSPEACAAQIGS